MPRHAALAALVATILLAAGSPAPAQLQPTASDPVVARVDGTEIRLSDVTEAARRLPEQFQGMPPQILYPLLIDQLISETVVTQAGRRERLHEAPELRRQLARLEDRLIQQALIAREIDAKVTDEVLRERYRREIADKPAEAEVRARHILLATETEARAVLAELARGADFAALARERSRGPGAAEGGDLGFFKRDEMPEAFAEAAFALAPGQVSPAPVRTQFGWHVIKVEERREQPRPSFEEAREDLRRAAAEEAAEALIERLRAAARIERFGLDGSPLR
ncbi:peptidylprolyl isomerase [Elioraea thermophila]|uniref:peptidylprolyl isomerase n=1 Tax=Elioraea thermophila TaxID=2185104 RepID=UPI000DF1E15C|nr:peptidylprolyl isomerase [Elioraea thermophila]